MSRYTGQKGKANLIYTNKVALTKSRLKTMPVVDKVMAMAVYADGNIYTINGCNGLEKSEPKFIRIYGREGSMYKVVFENSKTPSKMDKEELSTRFNIGEKCEEMHASNDVSYEEDR